MNLGGINLLDHLHIVVGLKPTVPSSSSPAWISLKNAKSVGVLVYASNATTVTGSAITLLQATAVAGTGSKALALPFYYSKLDTAAADVPWTKVTATSDTFTTDTTNSKDNLYFIPVDPASLDINNSFDCMRAGTANATAATITVLYLLGPKYAGNPTLIPSFILD